MGVGHLRNRAIPLFIFGGNAEALDGLFQRVDVHGLGEMLVHPGFLGFYSQHFQLRERIRQFPAVFPQQDFIIGDAIAILTHPTGTPTLAICPQGLCTDFPVKALLLFYHYVKNVSS